MSDSISTSAGQILEGTIVILARYPSIKWIAHQGWYTYQGRQYMGWYFASIPAQTILPLNEEDLIGIQIVSGGSCPCPSPSPTPCPPPGPGGGLDHVMKHELERAWITVDTREQLSLLNKRLVPDGKIVRVNDVGDGTAKYYRYDQSNSIWTEEYFGVDTTNFVTRDALEQEVADQVSQTLPGMVSDEVDKQLETADLADPVTNVIQNNTEVQKTIQDITEMKWKTIQEG